MDNKEIEEMPFYDKVVLLGQLLDNLDITFTAHYGAEGYACSSNITTTKDEKVFIWTGIMTG
jgi:hypothetical protein